MENKEDSLIGQLGWFCHNNNKKIGIAGRLTSTTPEGKVKDQDGVVFDFFEKFSESELLKCEGRGFKF